MDFKYDGRAERSLLSSTGQQLTLIGEGKRVLEIGCATGFMSKALTEQQGCKVSAVEIDPAAAERAKAYCEQVVCGDIERLDLQQEFSGLFDVVLFGDVLEHLRDPVEVLRKVKHLLHPDGYVVASLPNVTHLSVALELLQGRFPYRPTGLLDETHLRFFSAENVRQLFATAGYTVKYDGRVRVPPEGTEFQTSLAAFPEELIAFAKAANPEHDTYQFIVKAVKADQVAVPTEMPASEVQKAHSSDKWVLQLVERLREREREVLRLNRLLAQHGKPSRGSSNSGTAN